MTMKSYVVGRETKAMLTQSSSWGTVSSGGDGLLFENASFKWEQAQNEIILSNSYWKERLEPGQISCSIEINQPFMFNDLRCLAMTMGYAGYSAPQEKTEGMGDYLHQLVPSTTTGDLFATLACKRAEGIYSVFPSCAFQGFEISGSTDPNRIMIKHMGLADTAINGAAGIADVEFSNLSYAYDQRAYFRNLKVYIADADGTPITTDDEITNLIKSIHFSFNRTLSKDYTNTSGNSIESPVEESAPGISLKLGLIRKDAILSTFFNDRMAATRKQIVCEVVAGPANPAEGSPHENARLTIEIPAAVVVSDNFVGFDGMDRQSGEVGFDILAPESTSASMPFAEPFRISIVNNLSSRAISQP